MGRYADKAFCGIQGKRPEEIEGIVFLCNFSFILFTISVFSAVLPVRVGRLFRLPLCERGDVFTIFGTFADAEYQIVRNFRERQSADSVSVRSAPLPFSDKRRRLFRHFRRKSRDETMKKNGDMGKINSFFDLISPLAGKIGRLFAYVALVVALCSWVSFCGHRYCGPCKCECHQEDALYCRYCADKHHEDCECPNKCHDGYNGTGAFNDYNDYCRHYECQDCRPYHNGLNEFFTPKRQRPKKPSAPRRKTNTRQPRK